MKKLKDNLVVIMFIFVAVLVAMNVMLISKVNSTKMDLNGLQNEIVRLNSRISGLQGSIGSVKNDIQEELDKQNSLISSADYEIVNVNFTKGTCEIEFSLVPKTYAKDTLAYVIDDSGKEYELVLDGANFKANIPVTTSTNLKLASIKLVNGEEVAREDLNLFIDLENYFTINSSAELANAYPDVKFNKDHYTVVLDNNILMNYYSFNEFAIKNIEVNEYINERLVDTTKVKLDEVSQREYQYNNGLYFEQVAPLDKLITGDTWYQQPLNKEVKLEFSSTYRIEVVTTDNNGYKYYHEVYKVKVGDTKHDVSVAEQYGQKQAYKIISPSGEVVRDFSGEL